MNRVYKSVLDELGLTYPQYIVLVSLYEQDDQTVSSLGDKLFLNSSTLTPLLKRMEAMGHLTRQRNPEDEREVRLRLTLQGRSVREKVALARGELLKATGTRRSGLSAAPGGAGEIASQPVERGARETVAGSGAARLAASKARRPRL